MLRRTARPFRHISPPPECHPLPAIFEMTICPCIEKEKKREEEKNVVSNHYLLSQPHSDFKKENVKRRRRRRKWRDLVVAFVTNEAQPRRATAAVLILSERKVR